MRLIKKIIIKGMISIARVLGFDLSRSSSEESINNFLNNIRPKELGIELVRIGSDNDGGYLVPDDLVGVKYCFSPGVSDNSSFELHLSGLGIKCFLADYSVDEPEASKNEPNLDFDKLYVSSVNRANSISLEYWYNSKVADDDGEHILQMDIEGDEYSTLLAMPRKIQNNCRIMVIEFHQLWLLRNRFANRIMTDVIEKLLETHYVAHAHPNNCCGYFYYGRQYAPNVIELTFIRKDRVHESGDKRVLLEQLDQDNVINKQSIGFPSCWRAQ
ncbi:MAG: hypothetical protein SVT56_09410 [Chloroflexota bacterium]|nr:hypothetical protein [Chloroflexota bacterium]